MAKRVAGREAEQRRTLKSVPHVSNEAFGQAASPDTQLAAAPKQYPLTTTATTLCDGVTPGLAPGTEAFEDVFDGPAKTIEADGNAGSVVTQHLDGVPVKEKLVQIAPSLGYAGENYEQAIGCNPKASVVPPSLQKAEEAHPGRKMLQVKVSTLGVTAAPNSAYFEPLGKTEVPSKYLTDEGVPVPSGAPTSLANIEDWPKTLVADAEKHNGHEGNQVAVEAAPIAGPGFNGLTGTNGSAVAAVPANG